MLYILDLANKLFIFELKLIKDTSTCKRKSVYYHQITKALQKDANNGSMYMLQHLSNLKYQLLHQLQLRPILFLEEMLAVQKIEGSDIL